MSGNARKIEPYGTWESPIKAKLIAEKSLSKDDVLIDKIISVVYHIETRASEGGRNVVVESESGTDLFGEGWNARTGVHEYGGASAIIYNKHLFFSNISDGQVYTVDLNTKLDPRRVTDNPTYRFADFAVYPKNPSLIVCICEDHTNNAPSDVVNSLVAITASDSPMPSVALVTGADFYSNPCFNDDGNVMAWCQWNHPYMPWDGCQIFVAGVQVKDNQISLSSEILPTICVAGQAGTICALQPTWVDSRTLVFACDISGYANPWISTLTAQSAGTAKLSVDTRSLLAKKEPHDFCDPQWWLGSSNFAVIDDKSLLFSVSKDGRHYLYIVLLNGTMIEIACPYVNVTRMRRVSDRKIAFLGMKIDQPKALVLLLLNDAYEPTYTPIKLDDGASKVDFGPWISAPQPMTLMVQRSSTAEKLSGSSPLHILFFPPKNPDYTGPESEKPCTIVNVHGGPTSMESQGLSMEKQFFTSRGWAWIDINYGGSSNYGREYIELLKGNWGIVDVEDCVIAVNELSSAKYGLVDPKRVVIRGVSAGGYTTLYALSNPNPDFQVFAAGASSCGISDLRKLVETTHKFQSCYVQGLLGGTYGEKPEVYRSRSPIFFSKNIKSPLLILQGSVDPIVPPSQAEDIVKVVKEQGGDIECILFEGEGHGWRQAATIERALEAEVAFYERVLGLNDSN